MGLRKTWSFDKIDWDKEIAEGNVHISPDNFQSLNRTELVEILRLRGVRAHRGISKAELIMLLERGEMKRTVNPIDSKRDTIMAFLSKNWDKIRDQIMPQCGRDCYQHHDIEVIMCYLASEDKLDQEV